MNIRRVAGALRYAPFFVLFSAVPTIALAAQEPPGTPERICPWGPLLCFPGVPLPGSPVATQAERAAPAPGSQTLVRPQDRTNPAIRPGVLAPIKPIEPEPPEPPASDVWVSLKAQEKTIWGGRILGLWWSGALGEEVDIWIRKVSTNEKTHHNSGNDGYYSEAIPWDAPRGDYRARVCNRKPAVCSDEVEPVILWLWEGEDD